MPNFSSDYIIRIYRFDKKKLHHVVGTAEEVGVKEKKRSPPSKNSGRS